VFFCLSVVISPVEFDGRFNWDDHTDVESYLAHQGDKFEAGYDPKCFMLLSKCMDLMNLSRGFRSMRESVERIPLDKECMLLSVTEDALISAAETKRLAVVLASRGLPVHFEELSSSTGHDAFLMPHTGFVERIRAFFSRPHGVASVEQRKAGDGVGLVRSYISSLNS
jgi:homoserine acetyltransferase